MSVTTRPVLASAMARLGTESAFVVLARARQLEAEGKSIIHLEIGEPDFDTPENIVGAGVKALRDGWTHYGPSAGLPEFREAIAANVNQWRDVDTGPAEIVVTPGAKPVMFFSILALCEPGDEVLYPDPGFPDLQIDDRLHRRQGRAHTAPAGEQFPHRSGPASGRYQRAHQAPDPQLPRQPHRWIQHPRRHRGDRRDGARPRDLRAH